MDSITGKYRDGGSAELFHTRWKDEVYTARGVFGPLHKGAPPRIEVSWQSMPWVMTTDDSAHLPDTKYMSVVNKKNARDAAWTLAKYLSEDPMFTTDWKGLAEPVDREYRKHAVMQIMSAYVKHGMDTHSVLELDGCKGVVITVPVRAGSHNVVAPGPGIFAQLKQVGGGLSPGELSNRSKTISDPPESVLRLSHLKARRMEGRSYIYLWAIAVDLDKTVLPTAHQMAYLAAMVCIPLNRL
jgi:hypothetical protein